MKTTHTFIAFALALLISLFSCSGEKENTEASHGSPRIKKHSKLVTPKVNSEYILGDAVDFSIESKETIDSIVLDYEGQTKTYQEPNFQWTADQAKTGTQKLRVTVYANGITETHYPKIRFFSDTQPEAYTYEVIRELPHDPEAYVQGLFFLDDTLVESTGREGLSRLSKTNLLTAEKYQTVNLSSQYFGEGSTVWENQIIQLTWTSQVGFVYNRALEQTNTFHYTHEGWGVTTLNNTLVVSDGTEVLHLLDPRDFSETGRLEVYTHDEKIVNLNELEVIDGLIYANVWMEDLIVVVDPKTGKVLRNIDMTGLSSQFNPREIDALNGIAHQATTGRTYVTGKLWPKLFEVTFKPKN